SAMTFSVPSALAAVTSALMPPPAVAEVWEDQLVPPLEPPEELDEQPAVSSAAATIPANAYR
ncbi:MAG: hypothetical protein ACRDYC_10600, partial [Acidimicrobiales bacterium]